MIYAAFRAWKTLRRYFISLPSKTAFYCVTKSREPTTNESDVFSVLACTLFVSVDDKLVSILPYHRKANNFRDLNMLLSYLLLNCGARLAAFKPYFFLSFILGSLVKNPAFFNAGLKSVSTSSNALEIPCLIAPA